MPTINCVICGNGMYAKPSHIMKGWGKYCSKACQYIGQKTGSSQPCYICNKSVYRNQKEQVRSKSGKFFCSKSCQTIWRNSVLYTGDQHSNWNGGLASYRNRLIRSTLPQICGKCQAADKRILAVHHKDRNRQNNKLSNLMWLCHNCHYLVHHYREESKGFLVAVA